MSQRRRRALALALALGCGLTMGACLAFPTEKQCKRACLTARGCGLLPSALGGSNTETIDEAQLECELRCQSTLLETETPLAQLLTLLESTESATLCSDAGRMTCAALSSSIAASDELASVQVTSELTVYMADVRSFVAAFQPERWCESSYFGESAVIVTQSVAIPTKACFDAITAASDCATVQGLYNDASEQADCRYVRLSQVAALEGMNSAISGCTDDDATTLLGVKELVSDLAKDWGLGDGGLLINGGAVETDLDALANRLNEQADRELRGVDGIFRDVCIAYESEQASGTPGTTGTTGTTGTSTGDGGTNCDVAPLCRELDCDSDVIHCDPALCELGINGPSRDCGLLGIQSIQLGFEYKGVRELAPDAVLGCGDAAAAHAFSGVPLAQMKPIAIVAGALPEYLVPVDVTPEDEEEPLIHEYTWHVEGAERWTRAGTSRLVVPSPQLRYLQAQYSNPLEMLGWVRIRLPESEACNEQPQLCEGYFNNNCDDGLDNDGNGLTDREEPWCDALFNELADACLVAHHALMPNPDCNIEDDEP